MRRETPFFNYCTGEPFRALVAVAVATGLLTVEGNGLTSVAPRLNMRRETPFYNYGTGELFRALAAVVVAAGLLTV